ncbi:MAG: universal stress protein F [Hyphomicrobiaceae bacterium]|jgi:universal stress protein F
MFKKILLPIDYAETNPNDPVLAATKLLAEQNSAELMVVSVIPEIVRLPNLPEDYGSGAAKFVADNLQTFLDSVGIKAELTIKQGSVYREILKLAHAESIDLVVMSSPKGDFPDYPLGPNVARVTRHANCSVLVVRE